MTDSQNAMQPAEDEVQARLKDMEEENELLLLQLHQVQEELERYFLKCQELENGGSSAYSGSTSVGGWVDDELPSLQAEVLRLTALVETQTRLREIEARNALNARLGDILIQSVSPSGSLVGLPGKLMGIWRASKAQQPSAALGGKNFDKIIEVFQKGGLESVKQLLAAEPAPEMRAKAYTALARHQMKNGLFADAALSARRAYEEEPKPFRLKWLAFRLHDAGEIAEGDACLSLLPQDTPFSDSESRQRDQVRYEAKSARLRDAKQKTGFESRRQAMENQIQTLRQDCVKFNKLAAERKAKITSLQQARAKLEQEKTELALRLEESAKLAAEREAKITSLHQAQAKRDQEKADIALRLEESAKLAAEREAEITSLRQAQAKLEQEKADIALRHEESAKLAAERQGKELTRMRDTLSKVVKKEITTSIKQLEAFFNIQSYFGSGQILGELHGWAISPDLAFYLIQHLEANHYNLVIEFGSGTSTQLIAKTLDVIADRKSARPKPVQTAFEHLERCHIKTQALLQLSGLADAVTVFHTPLKPYTGADGTDYEYYDCAPALQDLTKAIPQPIHKVLVLVDGPPGKTGPHARYPALPLLLQYFPDSQMDLIMDDYNRPEEKEIVGKWVKDLQGMQKKFEMFEENLDKGACKLIIEARTDSE